MILEEKKSDDNRNKNKNQKNQNKKENKRQRTENEFKSGCVVLFENLGDDQTGATTTTTETSTLANQANSDSSTTTAEAVSSTSTNDQPTPSTTDQTTTETKKEEQTTPLTTTEASDKMETTTTTETKKTNTKAGNGKVFRKKQGPPLQDLKQHFGKYGMVKWIYFDHNLSFVQFADPESATKALSDDGSIFGLSVKKSIVEGEAEKTYFTKVNMQRNSQNKKRGPPHKKFRR